MCAGFIHIGHSEPGFCLITDELPLKTLKSFLRIPSAILGVYFCMHPSLAFRCSVLGLLAIVPFAASHGQKEATGSPCPTHPNTLRAMHGCFRPLVVFAPTLDNPQLVEQFNQLKTHTAEMKSRDLLYVPIVPEGHNQPIPGSRIPTANLSEDELAATRLRFKVEPAEFLVILIGKDGEEKLKSRTPLSMDQLKPLIDSMPMRKDEMKQDPQGKE
jgi:Domain of unknown function (DUF4174)